jgi:hypothetical protein
MENRPSYDIEFEKVNGFYNVTGRFREGVVSHCAATLEAALEKIEERAKEYGWNTEGGPSITVPAQAPYPIDEVTDLSDPDIRKQWDAQKREVLKALKQEAASLAPLTKPSEQRVTPQEGAQWITLRYLSINNDHWDKGNYWSGVTWEKELDAILAPLNLDQKIRVLGAVREAVHPEEVKVRKQRASSWGAQDAIAAVGLTSFAGIIASSLLIFLVSAPLGTAAVILSVIVFITCVCLTTD